jgi:hypothetical protein
MMQGKIALEEHFMLPSFEAYGADASALDGATKAHNYDPGYFAAVQKRSWARRRCGLRTWTVAASSASACH